jgi:hypothetical protein
VNAGANRYALPAAHHSVRHAVDGGAVEAALVADDRAALLDGELAVHPRCLRIGEHEVGRRLGADHDVRSRRHQLLALVGTRDHDEPEPAHDELRAGLRRGHARGIVDHLATIADRF